MAQKFEPTGNSLVTNSEQEKKTIEHQIVWVLIQILERCIDTDVRYGVIINDQAN